MPFVICPDCQTAVRRSHENGQLFDGPSFNIPHSCPPTGTMQKVSPILLPMNGRIVVEAVTEDKTSGGLYLPHSAATEQRATIGKVIALPAGYAKLVKEAAFEGESFVDTLSLGDVVLFGQNSGMSIDLGYGQARRKAIILRETEVLCKVSNPDGTPYA